MIVKLDEENWCRQPSTRRSTVDSVHGVGRTGTARMDERHHSVDKLLMLGNKGQNSFVDSRGRRTAGNQLTFLRKSGAQSDQTRT